MLLEDPEDWLGRFLRRAEDAIQSILEAFDDESPWLLDRRRQEVAYHSDRLRDLWATYPERLKRHSGGFPTVEALLESIAAHLEILGQKSMHPASDMNKGCALCGGELSKLPATAICLDCTIGGNRDVDKFEPPWGESCPCCGGGKIFQAQERRFCLGCAGAILPMVRGLRSRFSTGMI